MSVFHRHTWCAYGIGARTRGVTFCATIHIKETMYAGQLPRHVIGGCTADEALCA